MVIGGIIDERRARWIGCPVERIETVVEARVADGDILVCAGIESDRGVFFGDRVSAIRDLVVGRGN